MPEGLDVQQMMANLMDNKNKNNNDKTQNEEDKQTSEASQETSSRGGSTANKGILLQPPKLSVLQTQNDEDRLLRPRTQSVSSVQSNASAKSGASATSDASITSRKKRKNDEGDLTEKYCKQFIEMNDIMADMLQTLASRLKKQSVKEKLDVMHEEVEKLKKLATSMALENAQLRGALMEKKELTYSRALSIVPQPKEKAPVIMVNKKKVAPKKRYTAIIKAQTEEAKSSDEVKAEALKYLKPVEKGIRIDAIRKIKGGIAIELPAKSDLEKIKANGKFAEHSLKVTEPQQRRPKIIIYDVPAEMSEEEVVSALLAQNDSIMQRYRDQPLDEEQLSLKFKIGKRGLETVNWVAEVQPEVRNLLRKENRVYIDARRCKIADFTRLTRCFKCQGVGHIAKFCKDKEDTCSHCAEKGHRQTACMRKEGKPKCALCARVGKPADHKGDVNCPTYKLYVEKQQYLVDYGQ